MIIKTQSFQTADGTIYPTIEAAQAHSLAGFFGGAAITPEAAAHIVVENKDKFIDILTTNPKSRARSRKINGGTRKPRAPRTITTPPESPEIV